MHKNENSWSNTRTIRETAFGRVYWVLQPALKNTPVTVVQFIYHQAAVIVLTLLFIITNWLQKKTIYDDESCKQVKRHWILQNQKFP